MPYVVERTARLRSSCRTTTSPNRPKPISRPWSSDTRAQPGGISIPFRTMCAPEQPACTPPASRGDAKRCGDVTTAIEPSRRASVFDRTGKEQSHAGGIEHEHEGHEERWQSVFPGLQRRLVGIAAVIAAAAKGERAVGGETSESTA